MAEKRWNVVWSDSAARDLVDTVACVARKSPDEARRLLTAIRSEARTLDGSPRTGSVVPELASAGVRDWRELAIESHRILFRVHDRVVRVGAVLDGRRDLEDLLLGRLTRLV